MTEVSTSITIDKPADEVFDFVADMSNNPRWQKGQVSCQWTSPPPIAVGSTYDQVAKFAGRTIKSSFRVSEFEPGELIRIESTSGPMPIDVTRTVTPLSDTSCEVSAIVRGEPPGAARHLSGQVDKLVQRNVSADYERLKEWFEADPNLRPNHHDNYPQFDGFFGVVGALKMITGQQHNADLAASLTTGLGPEAHILDIGCGPGVAVRTAARSGAKVTGLDPSAPMLNMAKALTAVRRPEGEVTWVQAGAESIPIPDNSIDVCWSIKTVHHWPDLDGGLAEVARVLKPGGLFFILEKKTEPGATGTLSHGWTPRQAEILAGMLRNDHGFTDVEVDEQIAGPASVLTVSARTTKL